MAEGLGRYVYALRDPRDGTIFYVGKGVGDRACAHAVDERKVSAELSPEQLKLGRIREIHRQGSAVGIEIVRHGIADEETVLEVEAAVIDALRLAGCQLTNLVRGHGTDRGWASLAELEARYGSHEVKITEPSLLIRIARRYDGAGDEGALYEATRKWWTLGPRRANAHYAFAVFDGIVRGVYRIEGWERPPQDERTGRLARRWAFRGARDPGMEDRYLFGNVRALLPNGAQNPIRYINC